MSLRFSFLIIAITFCTSSGSVVNFGKVALRNEYIYHINGGAHYSVSGYSMQFRGSYKVKGKAGFYNLVRYGDGYRGEFRVSLNVIKDGSVIKRFKESGRIRIDGSGNIYISGYNWINRLLLIAFAKSAKKPSFFKVNVMGNTLRFVKIRESGDYIDTDISYSVYVNTGKMQAYCGDIDINIALGIKEFIHSFDITLNANHLSFKDFAIRLAGYRVIKGNFALSLSIDLSASI